MAQQKWPEQQMEHRVLMLTEGVWGQCISPGKEFYPYVKPIVYKDTEPVVHGKEEMICNRHKSFNLR